MHSLFGSAGGEGETAWRAWAPSLPICALLLALLTIQLGGCATGGPSAPPATGAERAAYDAALDFLPDDPEAAQAALEAYLRDYPTSPLCGQAAEYLAKIAYDQGRTDDVFRWLYKVLREYPESPRAEAVRLRLARMELDRGVTEESQRLAGSIRESRLSAAERVDLMRLLADLAESPVTRLERLARARFLAERLEAEKRSAVIEAIEGDMIRGIAAMSVAELERAAADNKGRTPAALVRLTLAERALARGERELALTFLEDARRHEIGALAEGALMRVELGLGLAGDDGALPTFAEAAARVPQNLSEAQGTVGVVLPLSGRFGSFGDEALRGVLLAAGIFDRERDESEDSAEETEATPSADLSATPPDDSQSGPGFVLAPEAAALFGGPDVRLIVRDSAGRPERAARAVRDLAEQDDVLAIIGPIGSKESEAAARAAQEAGIPLLTLSNRQEIAAERDQVFRLRLTIDDEVGFLVDYATQELDARRFAVLYPKTRFGLGMRAKFWEAVEARGGQVVAAASYAPDATDHSSAIRSMIGYSLLTDDERVALRERDRALRRGRRLEPEDQALLRHVLYPLMGPELEVLPPVIDFDAIFIPDAYDKIGLIAPQLALHEISGVRLLGTSDWNHPDLVRIARSHVRGAVISSPFFADSRYEAPRTFTDDYRSSFDMAPSAFSSYAYDGTMMVLAQLASGRLDREAVRQGILGTQGYLGASGVTSIMPDGNARKRPFMLGVTRSRIVGLD